MSQSQDTKSMEAEPPEAMHLSDKQPPESIAQGKLIGFVDTVCADDLNERRSTTGRVCMHSGDDDAKV